MASTGCRRGHTPTHHVQHVCMCVCVCNMTHHSSHISEHRPPNKDSSCDVEHVIHKTAAKCSQMKTERNVTLKSSELSCVRLYSCYFNTFIYKPSFITPIVLLCHTFSYFMLCFSLFFWFYPCKAHSTFTQVQC